MKYTEVGYPVTHNTCNFAITHLSVPSRKSGFRKREQPGGPGGIFADFNGIRESKITELAAPSPKSFDKFCHSVPRKLNIR